MDALTKTLLTVVLSALASGGLVWLLMDRRALLQRIAALERLQANGPAWSQEMKLDHRQQLVSIAALNKLAARDLLDVLMRVSPDMAREIVEEIAPHLIQKDGIK